MTEEIKDNEIQPEPEETKTEEPKSEVKAEEDNAPAAAQPERPARTERPERPERRESSYRGHGGGRYSGDKKQFDDYQGEGQRFPKFRKKICKFCYDSNIKIDYKNSDLLSNFITDRGKILPRRVTGTCARHQRAVAREIKKARIIALLPFVEK